MRRTISLTVAAAAVLAAGTVASAAPAGPATTMPATTTPATTTPATMPAMMMPAASAAAAAPAAGREQVGTVEQVEAVLGYLDGQRSVTFHYPGASYVKVHLSRLLLLPGDYLTVSDPSGAEVHRYDGGSLLGVGDLLTGGQWAMSITGDTALVTLHTSDADPIGLRDTLARLGVVINKVARGFGPAEQAQVRPAVRTPQPESICGRNDSADAVCYRSSHPTVYRNTKPVARLLINGVELCTAFRVGPGNRMLTNNHCFAESRQARSTEVWFNYQCAECGGWAVFRPTKVRAHRVLATDQVLDFTLFTIDNFDRVRQFGYLELDPRTTRVGERIYIPQHPRGLPTRVALTSDRDRGGHCRVGNPTAHGYGWYTDVAYYCDTQGGSSGSPVLSRDTHRVVALHHFGGCPNSGVRIDLIYERIARHL